MTDAAFIADYVRAAAQAAPDAPGWSYEGREWTWPRSGSPSNAPPAP